jgi:hypothetical protein
MVTLTEATKVRKSTAHRMTDVIPQFFDANLQQSIKLKDRAAQDFAWYSRIPPSFSY